MNIENFLAINELCQHYKVEISFFHSLNEIGLIEIHTIKQAHYLHRDSIHDLEKIMRIHHELNINMEGIDVVFNLLKKVDDLQNELHRLKSRLSLYENF